MVFTTGSINNILDTQIAQNQFNSMSAISLISQRLLEQSKENSPELAVDFEKPDIRKATKAITKMVAFKEKISDSVSVITKAKDAINWAKTYLNRAKTDLNFILGSSSEIDRAAAASSFNEHLRNINAKIDGANQIIDFKNVNLIGNTEGPDWDTDNVFLPSNLSGGGIIQVDGNYLGIDFQVIDTDGFQWRLDGIDNTFYQYDISDTSKRTGQSISSDGLTIETYNPNTGAVTFGGTGSLTGTLQRAGLNLLTSEYYNNFSDDTSVQTAISDIDKALALINTKGSSILTDAALLEGRIKITDAKLKNLEAEKKLLISEEIDESKALSKAEDTKVRLALMKIDLISQANNGLVENMLMLSNGPQKASGLFGLMGY